MFEMILTVKGKQFKLREEGNDVVLYEVYVSPYSRVDHLIWKNSWGCYIEAFSEIREIFLEIIENDSGIDSEFSLRCSWVGNKSDWCEDGRYFQFNLQKVADGWYIVSAFSNFSSKIEEIEYAKFKYYYRAYDYFMYFVKDYLDFYYLYDEEEVQ